MPKVTQQMHTRTPGSRANPWAPGSTASHWSSNWDSHRLSCYKWNMKHAPTESGVRHWVLTCWSYFGRSWRLEEVGLTGGSKSLGSHPWGLYFVLATLCLPLCFLPTVRWVASSSVPIALPWPRNHIPSHHRLNLLKPGTKTNPSFLLVGRCCC